MSDGKPTSSMPPDSMPANNMAGLQQFKYFTALPRELQLMIWDCFWEARGGTVHCFPRGRGYPFDHHFPRTVLYMAYRPSEMRPVGAIDLNEELEALAKLGSQPRGGYCRLPLELDSRFVPAGKHGQLEIRQHTNYTYVSPRNDLLMYSPGYPETLQPLESRAHHVGFTRLQFIQSAEECKAIINFLGRFKSLKQVTVIIGPGGTLLDQYSMKNTSRIANPPTDSFGFVPYDDARNWLDAYGKKASRDSRLVKRTSILKRAEVKLRSELQAVLAFPWTIVVDLHGILEPESTKLGLLD
ncbi:Uu.00g140880.m01.CDS01 [Anthostomella pinea]|uniref:Uu.00g140880.m01.CDS01 n=1 Tax=Anthostomella pinea TaxID=933095 RepID=A0AAI8YLE1_9PEZI|nr:Uu.00g140880.m01.CDS01 [Anthostomella pinea]